MQPLGVDEPTVIGPYRLLGRLGSGGMGRVYLGRSAGGRTVAVKVVHPHLALDEEFRARFRREVAAARRVGGAWTAPVLDADPEAPVPWVATAYAAGPSLAAAVADGGPLPAHSVRALGAGLGEALAAVHELGLVHRDVKPSNVLLTLDGPLLIDFGVARALDGTASLTSTGVSVGSPGYMSPEQILGKGVTGAADVFSLGAVLAYAATGEPPFPGDSSAALLYKVVHEDPQLDALEGGLLREVVEGCLAKEPRERPTPAEVARRLAPEGAAGLVASGWLPGVLVEQVTRGAVRLLNLEAAGAETGAGVGAGAGAPSGPVGFSRPAVGEGAAVGGGSAVGAFGPPPVMPGAVPEPRTAEPEVPASGKRPGKLSVSVAATAAPEADGRGRRVSCTVALAVAGAFAAATVGSVFVFDLLPGERRDSAGDSGSDDAYSPAPSASLSTGPSGIPTRYLGTWEGQGTALDGTLPAGTFRVTVQQAEVGEELGQLRQTDQLGGVCVDVLTLKQVTEKQLVARSVGQKGNHGGCNQEPTTVRLVPTGDDLTYESDSARSGYPKARMSKVK
ncbi:MULTISPECIES: serine/threonine-protein kinase [unclassified Streptomyces]|uniref:serine/threonine-protein kinase n=1 Tax=unclassified Streptomyces TaxID=2593676 RepID=UPI001487C693|nr:MULTISPECIES: serine/threonine-protein kinase [unclassified Streptomyces]